MPLLKRTDTRTGSDPPRKCRAASIAKARRVTSRCHLHNFHPRDQRDRNARGGAHRKRVTRPAAGCALSNPAPSLSALGPAHQEALTQRPEMYSGARPSGRCSPAGSVSPFLETKFLFLITKARVPSAGSRVFHFLQALRFVGTCCMHEWTLGRDLVRLI